jgi:hypothetical protein
LHGQQNIKSEEMFTDSPFFQRLDDEFDTNIATAKNEAMGWKEKKPVLVFVNSIFQRICRVINESLQCMYGKCPCRNLGWRNKLHFYIVVPDWYL